METIRAIVYVAVMLIAFFFAFGLFIQTAKELWEDVGKEATNDMISWFRHTTLGMWYFNKKNKVEILSDNEYRKLLEAGKITPIEIKENN